MKEISTKRFIAPDQMKAIWILGIVLVHSTIYGFDGIYQMDLSNPPISMILFSLFTYWGALFTIIACWLHVQKIYERLKQKKDLCTVTIKNSFITAGFLLIIHYLYNFVFGVIQLEFAKGENTYTVVTALARNFNLNNLSWERLTDGSTFSTIAFSLIFCGVIIYIKEKYKLERYFTPILLSIIGLFLASSVLRVYWFPQVDLAIQNHQYLLQFIYSFVLDKPYPLIPYLSFATLGMLIGYAMSQEWKKKKIIGLLLSIAVVVLPIAILLIMNNEISIAAIDWFGIGRLLVELIVSCIALSIIIGIFGYRKAEFNELTGPQKTLRLVATYSLTLYMFQPLVSELTKHLWNVFGHQWAFSVNSTILFGLFNVATWVGLIWVIANHIPEQLRFEYWWNKWYELFDRESDKR